MDECILIVEDDPSVRETAMLAFDRAGMKASSVGDGRDALPVFACQRFDLVVLDLMLPGVDGFEVCRVIGRTRRSPC